MLSSEFPQFLGRLLESRALSQSKLAAKAGVSIFTINRAMAGKNRNWSDRTCQKVIGALEDAKSLNAVERMRWLQHTGMPENLLPEPLPKFPEAVTASIRSLTDRMDRLRRTVEPLNAREARLVYCILELAQHVGHDKADAMVSAAAGLAGVSIKDADEIVMTIRRPPAPPSTPAVEVRKATQKARST